MITGLSLLWFQWQFSINIRDLMDTKIDPCVDFYKFSCGNYYKKYPIPADKAGINTFDQADDGLKKELRRLFEEKEKPDDPKSTILVKRFYKSCVDVASLEKLGITPLKQLLNKYGGWPVVEGDKWNESEYNWLKTNARLTTTIADRDFLRFGLQADLKNSSRKILIIDQAGLGLPAREYYVDEATKSIRDAYLKYMISSAIMLGASEDDAKEQMQDVLNFEIALAQANMKDEDRRDKNAIYHPTTVKELKKNYPKINFDTWFKTVASETGLVFKDNANVNLNGKPFLDKLADLLEKFSPQTLANYQMWHLVYGYTSLLAPSLRENSRKFQQALYGITQLRERKDECFDDITTHLPLPVGAMYVKKYFNNVTKTEVDQMTTNIRQAMKSSLEKIDWMDDKTRRNALTKLDTMLQDIAFPWPDIYNETYVLLDYKNATNLKPNTYFDNRIAITVSKAQKAIREFFKPTNRTEWISGIATSGAWYVPEVNKMTCAAGTLRYPFYGLYAPNYFNYGHIAAIMGHELTHGFDDYGRQYDEKGNFELWWTNETLSKFLTRANCFVQQFNNIKDDVTNQSLNGKKTQGENIADAGGLKLAYTAYKKDLANEPGRSDPRNKVLPGLTEFTADQLFFISYAQNWCMNIRPEGLQFQINSDEHSPYKYRGSVPLKNNRDFATVFNCREGSPMNPKEKCELW